MNICAKTSDCDSDRRASEGLSSSPDSALSTFWTVSPDTEDQVLMKWIKTLKIKVLNFLSTRFLIFSYAFFNKHLFKSLWRIEDKIKRFCARKIVHSQDQIFLLLYWFSRLRIVLLYHFSSRYARLQLHFPIPILPSNESFHCIYKGDLEEWTCCQFTLLHTILLLNWILLCIEKRKHTHRCFVHFCVINSFY